MKKLWSKHGKRRLTQSTIVDPADYQPVLNEMKKSGGAVSKETNFRLAKKVYALTAKYDKAISEYLAKK
jgi:phosphoribosylaminoimidazolecarboxamide formyltransferase/IMP cyclohydrolase